MPSGGGAATPSANTTSANGRMSTSMTSGKKTPSTDALRNFYFSTATNYTAFKSKADTSGVLSESANSPKTPTAAEPSTGGALVVRTASGGGTPTSAAPPAQLEQRNVPAGSAVRAAKAANSSAAAVATVTEATRPATSGAGANADAVSPEYIAFLRQQQDLVKSHSVIVEGLKSIAALTQQHRDDHHRANAGAHKLLRDAEGSTEWHWKSKFDLNGLFRDAELAVPTDELYAADTLPQIADLQHQHQQVVKLRRDHPSQTAFTLLLENGGRRFERLTKEFADSQLNAGPVTRVSDQLLVQLDHVMSVKPLSAELQDVDDAAAVIVAKQKECRGARDQALEDGAMDVAERESYRLADLGEELVAVQIQRIRLLSGFARDHAVSQEVRAQYSQQAAEQSDALVAESQQLRTRCEADLANLYKLCRIAEETEEQQKSRWEVDRKASDERITALDARQGEAWEQVTMLLKQIAALEEERHVECKRRIEEKVKDESRRNEYTVFRGVSEKHASTLDRTIRNCDVGMHCAQLMKEFVANGFHTIQKHLTECQDEISYELLESQKRHLDTYRGLLFSLGELDYKKGKKIDEVSENIQAAHIQQELCSESLNPNAKKFSDAKRELLRIRDELELELQDLKDRQKLATERFEPTERALRDAGLAHVHPTEELEDWRLDLREKMVKFKAMSLGHVSDAPLESEVAALRQTFRENKRLAIRSRGGANDSATVGHDTVASGTNKSAATVAL